MNVVMQHCTQEPYQRQASDCHNIDDVGNWVQDMHDTNRAELGMGYGIMEKISINTNNPVIRISGL